MLGHTDTAGILRDHLGPRIEDSSSYVFIQMPRFVPLAEYEKTVRLYVEHLSNYQDVRAVFKIGNVSAPGISDIDLFIVTDSKLKQCSPFSLSKENLPDSVQSYVIWHEPFVVDISIFSDIFWLFPVFSMKQIYGQKLTPKSLLSDERRYVAACFLHDIIVESYPREFLSVLISKRVKTRLLLARLHAFRYPLQLLSQLMVEDEFKAVTSAFLARIDALRSTWFDLDQKVRLQELINLTVKAVWLSLWLTELYATWLADDLGETAASFVKPCALYEGRRHLTLYYNGWSPEWALGQALFLSRKVKDAVSVLPASLMWWMRQYACGVGLVSTYIKRNLRELERCELGICHSISKKVSLKRIYTLNQQAAYLVANGFWYGYFNMFGFEQHRNKDLRSIVMTMIQNFHGKYARWWLRAHYR